MAELAGSLDAVDILPVLRLLLALERSGSLTISSDRHGGALGLDGGRIVSAAFGAERGVPAFDALTLPWEAGDFSFRAGQVPTERDVELPPEALLARAASLRVGLDGGLRQVLAPGAVPRVIQDGAANPSAEITLERAALAVLLSVDGERTVAEIATRHGFAVTVKELALLASLGFLGTEVPPPGKEAPPPGLPGAEAPPLAKEVRPSPVLRRRRPLLLAGLAGVSVALTGVALARIRQADPEPTTVVITGTSASAGGAGASTTTAATAAGPSAEAAALRTVLDERFADNRRGWPHDPQGTAWLSPGGYRLFARTPGQFVAVGTPSPEPLGSGQPPQWPWSDALVTAVFRKVGGLPGGGYGIVVRDQGPEPRDGVNQAGRFYVFEVSDRREIGVWRRESTRWVDIAPWTPSAAVRPDSEANELAVRADGQSLVCFVNGSEVARPRLTANVLARGGIGVFVGGDLNDVLLERFQVQVPG
jgi:hypothetical protein